MDDPLTISRLLRRLDCENVNQEILTHCLEAQRMNRQQLHLPAIKRAKAAVQAAARANTAQKDQIPGDIKLHATQEDTPIKSIGVALCGYCCKYGRSHIARIIPRCEFAQRDGKSA